MKRTLLAGLGIIALAGSGLALAPSASASTQATSYFTIYQNDNYGGGFCSFTGDDADLNNNYWTNASGHCNDGASSMKNNLKVGVTLYQTSHYTGDNYYAKPTSVDSDFSNNEFDNKASSVDVL